VFEMMEGLNIFWGILRGCREDCLGFRVISAVDEHFSTLLRC
jgi:hypothetical protein